MDKNKEEKIRHAIEELIGKGNLGIVGEIFATDYVAHAGEKEYSGHSFIKRFAKELRTAIPDMRVVEVKFLAQDVNTIIWQRTFNNQYCWHPVGFLSGDFALDWV